LENHFHSNHETCALHIDATFRSFILGELSVNIYCRKMKGFTDSLANLNVDVTDRVLMLNFLRRLNNNFKHLRAIFRHMTHFPSFQKVLDELCLEEIQQGIQGQLASSTTPTVLYTMQKPLSSSSSASRQERPPG
jgi:hypothetical protein